MTSDPDHSDQGASRTRVDSMVSLMHRDLSDPDIPEGKGIIFHYFFPHTTFLKIPLSRLSETNIYLRVTNLCHTELLFYFQTGGCIVTRGKCFYGILVTAHRRVW